MDWQPLETAPENTFVLVWADRACVGINEQRLGNPKHNGWHDDGEGFRLEPTHWMPLPSPPVQ